MESLQHKLDRVRPPRVQITYDVEIGNAIEMKELPFVVGIMADLSGHREIPLPKLKERKFVEVDRDNFDEVLSSYKPRLALRVANKVNPAEEHINVELHFSSMDDFAPLNIVKQTPALAALYESRVRLKDLLTKLDGNDALEEMLQVILVNADARASLKKEIEAAAPAPQAAPQEGE